MLDFTYTCRGCDNRFSLLVGDPKAQLCPLCIRALCGEVAEEISAELLEDLGRRNGEVEEHRPPAKPGAFFLGPRGPCGGSGEIYIDVWEEAKAEAQLEDPERGRPPG